MGQRRYPGATPFNSRQANIFFGRDKDIQKLLTLIQVEKKILLYSKSGLGKTSLLEAGVLPELPKNYIPISIRLFAYKEGGETPVRRVINALKAIFEDIDEKTDTIVDSIIGNDSGENSLWYYFKKAQIKDNQINGDDNESIFTLVFDQFEELFSHPKHDIEDFKNQLYELTELKLPNRFIALISEGRQNNQELFSRENLGMLHKKIEIKTVFAIRSDRLSLLNKLSDKIPDIQNTFYELLPLDYEQAEQAIIKPASDDNPEFETPPFTFHKAAINKIIDELSDDRKKNIETTQLQIVCHRIEEIAAAKAADGPRQIEVEDLPEFKNIFLNFYFDSINRLAEEKRDKAKRLIEDDLIRNHQRISLDEEVCKEDLNEEELRTLVNTHLLRAEQNTMGRFSYEISHDTLIEPILESKKKYLDDQERMKLEEERQEELRKLKEQQEEEAQERQRKIKTQRTIIAIVSVSFVISVAFGIYGNMKKREAVALEKIAQKNLNDLKSSEFSKNYNDGKNYEFNAQYKAASDKYKVALTFLDSLDVKQRIAECERLINLKDEHEKIIQRAQQLIDEKEYYEAMKALNEAIDNGYDSKGVQRARKDLYDQAKNIYKKDLADYSEMADNKVLLENTQRKFERLNQAYNNFNR